MKKNLYFLPTALILVTGFALLCCVLIRTFLPAWILPALNIPNMVLLSLLALLLDHYIAGDAGRCWICIPLFAALTFGLLPFLCGFARASDSWKLALCGAAVFSLVTALFTSIQNRLSSGPAHKAAPIVSALGLYLAFQCFAGILL